MQTRFICCPMDLSYSTLLPERKVKQLFFPFSPSGGRFQAQVRPHITLETLPLMGKTYAVTNITVEMAVKESPFYPRIQCMSYTASS